MNKVIPFLKYKPVCYSIHVMHDHEQVHLWVEDIAEDDKSRLHIAFALEETAKLIRSTIIDAQAPS